MDGWIKRERNETVTTSLDYVKHWGKKASIIFSILSSEVVDLRASRFLLYSFIQTQSVDEFCYFSIL